MPPEPLPWDRKDFFKERKHEKSESLGSAARWRDSYHGSREFNFNRWGPADFPRPASYGKQGSWHQFSEESGHGYGPSRSSGDKMLEDESFRTSLPRVDGKYIRTSRESRGSLGHRARWRDSYQGSCEFNRWWPADFRRPASYGKPGSWHQFPEDSSHGCGPSRSSSDNMLEDESFRTSLPRGDVKHIRTGRESRGSLSHRARWRDSYHGSCEFNRWGPAEFRRPASYGKRVSWHQFSEESGHGHGPSRSSGDKMLEDEGFRMSLPRGDGKYIRTGRESRGSFNHRDWRSHSRETNSGSVILPRRATHDETYSCPQSVSVSASDQIDFEDRNDEIDGVYDLENDARCDMEDSPGSPEWKPLKWNRSGSLSSWVSAFSGSTKSKNEKADLPLTIASPVESPSAEATLCATSRLPFEENTSRKKKRRLGWGDGLAKYEKDKVEAPDVYMKKEGALVSSSSAEFTHSLGSSLAEKSPKILAFSDCASPATPSSFACSSSSGLEEKSLGKTASVDNKTGSICSSPGPQLQESLFNLEKLETSSATNIEFSLVELLHSDDPNSGESSFDRSTALNKLLAYKSEISKTLEITESEIDLLETELKSLKSGNGGHISHLKAYSPLHVGESTIYAKERDSVANLVHRPAPLKIVSSDATVDEMPLCNGDSEVENFDMKDEEIDSPGTVTSKFNEPHCLIKAVPSNLVESDRWHEVTDAILPDQMKKVPASGAFLDEHKTIGCSNECIVAQEGYTHESISGDLTSQAGSRFSLCDSILAYNKEYANRAAEIFGKQLPAEQCKISTQSSKIIHCPQSDEPIKERFATRKRLLKFKESLLTLKFKAIRHLWKEDLRLRSVKKCRSRPQKKLELSLRVTHSGSQKYRTSFCSRFVQPGPCQNPDPTTNIIDYSSKLLRNPRIRLYRNALKMPALILDKKEKIASRFISHNGLVEDPFAVEKERDLINPWTSAERELFWEKLTLFGKDFRIISSFFDFKTTADCIEFYYKNHKSESFKKIKNLELGKQVKSSTINYLVTSGKKRNQEINAASLDMLSAVSVMAAHADIIGDQQKCLTQLSLGDNVESKVLWDSGSISASKNNFQDLQTERETVAADVLAGICGSLSSEAVSSCITSSVDAGEGYREWKCRKVESAMESSSVPDVMQHAGNEPCSEDSAGDVDSSNWTDEEKSIFIRAVTSYGKDFDMISRCVRSRSTDQCKVFFSKARKRLGLDLVHSSGDVETPGCGNDDASGFGTDTEDPSAGETFTARSCDESGSKPVDGLSTSANVNHEEPVSAEPANIQTSREIKEIAELQQLDVKGAEPVGNLVSDSCKEGDRLNLVSDSVCDITNHVASQSHPVHDHNLEDVSDNTEAGSNISSEPDILKAESVSIEDENLVALSEREATAQLAFEGEEKRRDAYSLGQITLGCSVQDSSGIGTSLALDGRSSGLNPQISHQDILEVDSTEKSCITSEGISLAGRNSALQDFVVVKKEEMLGQDRLSSAIDFREVRDTDQNPLLLRVESSEIPCSNHTFLSEVQELSKPDINCKIEYCAEECYPQRCSSSKAHTVVAELSLLSQNAESDDQKNHSRCAADSAAHSLVAELPLLPQNVESDDQRNHSRRASDAMAHSLVAELPLLAQNAELDDRRNHTRCASDSDTPRRNGDVKLFGKILSYTPSLQNSNTGSGEDTGKKGPQLSSSKSYDLEVNPSARVDRNACLGLENVPMRSYGFWDGNRIQTGLSALPDSAILQAKYPAAFSGYSAISAKTDEQQPLQAHASNGDRSLNGISTFPTKDGVVDHQSYRNRDGTKIQPFAVDIFSEMNRRNAFEALPLSSLQQQGRVFVGMNVVGRGGILMGDPCTGVSDPVAAIKMHYAKAEQYVGQSGSIFTRREDGWGNNGDLGSR